MATGFFGKIPASGDFVARNLGPGLRPAFDRWLTLYFAQYAQSPERWPEMGIRGTIDRPDGMPFAVLVLPSHDSAGRQFPLGFFAPGFKCDQVTINHWADVTFWIANQTITTLGTADGLAAALRDNIDPEKTDQPALKQSLWTTGPPMDIETAIRAFFSQQD